MKEVALTNGGIVLVDDRDYARVIQFEWFSLTIHGSIYAARNVNRGPRRQSILLMHRYLLGMWPGHGRGAIVDHRNNDGLDNQRANLRICHQRDAVRNQRVQSREKSSRFKGVHWHKRKSRWAAGISVRCKSVHLGYFTTEEAAAAAYNAAAQTHFGEFAAINIIEGAR